MPAAIPMRLLLIIFFARLGITQVRIKRGSYGYGQSQAYSAARNYENAFNNYDYNQNNFNPYGWNGYNMYNMNGYSSPYRNYYYQNNADYNNYRNYYNYNNNNNGYRYGYGQAKQWGYQTTVSPRIGFAGDVDPNFRPTISGSSFGTSSPQISQTSIASKLPAQTSATQSPWTTQQTFTPIQSGDNFQTAGFSTTDVSSAPVQVPQSSQSWSTPNRLTTTMLPLTTTQLPEILPSSSTEATATAHQSGTFSPIIDTFTGLPTFSATQNQEFKFTPDIWDGPGPINGIPDFKPDIFTGPMPSFTQFTSQPETTTEIFEATTKIDVQITDAPTATFSTNGTPETPNSNSPNINIGPSPSIANSSNEITNKSLQSSSVNTEATITRADGPQPPLWRQDKFISTLETPPPSTVTSQILEFSGEEMIDHSGNDDDDEIEEPGAPPNLLIPVESDEIENSEENASWTDILHDFLGKGLLISD